MEHFLRVEQPHSNTFCNHPSTLQLLAAYFARIRFRIRRGTYRDAVSGTRGRLANKEQFLKNRHIARPGMRFLKKIEAIKGFSRA